MNLSTAEYVVLGTIAAYLVPAGVYFLRDSNQEFVIYVGVLMAIFAAVFWTLRYTRLPTYLLALLAFWGLLHVLGGAVSIDGGVLFGYRIYPVFDGGGEFYILKYDQVVHAYLYGVVALAAHHLMQRVLGVRGHTVLVALVAVTAALGVSALNEIMEFLIAVSIERHGVGGYHNAMLDLVFNLAGAVAALGVYGVIQKLKRSTQCIRMTARHLSSVG